MAIEEQTSFPHWNYFLALDDDLERLSRFIEFTEANYECFSIELARTLMLASAEVDVVAKQLCKTIAPDRAADKITHYQAIIPIAYSYFANATVYIPRHAPLKLCPWENWAKNQTPDWWRAHNDVKHDRHTHFSNATLKNALNAVAALLLAVIHLYPDAARGSMLAPNPKLFRVGDPIGSVLLLSGDGVLSYGVERDG